LLLLPGLSFIHDNSSDLEGSGGVLGFVMRAE